MTNLPEDFWSGVYPDILADVDDPYFPDIGLGGKVECALLADGLRVVLLRTFWFVYGGIGYIIPAAFVTDFASVPQVFWDALPPRGPYSIAALCHDYLYWAGLCSKETADNALLDFAEEFGAEFLDREALYEGVRIGGQAAWDHYRELQDARMKG